MLHELFPDLLKTVLISFGIGIIMSLVVYVLARYTSSSFESGLSKYLKPTDRFIATLAGSVATAIMFLVLTIKTAAEHAR
jgi:hypothetical protein